MSVIPRAIHESPLQKTIDHLCHCEPQWGVAIRTLNSDFLCHCEAADAAVAIRFRVCSQHLRFDGEFSVKNIANKVGCHNIIVLKNQKNRKIFVKNPLYKNDTLCYNGRA